MNLKHFTRHQKWGLFCILTASLGFSLSMDPTFKKYDSIDLAQTASPFSGTPSGVLTASASGTTTASGTHSAAVSEVDTIQASSREVLVGGRRGSFKAKVYKVENSTIARFENLDTAAEACDLCKATVVLSADFSDIAALTKELVSLANESSETTTTEDSEQKPVQVKGQATEVDIEEWAAKCEEKEADSAKLTCHKNRIIELSKFLKNSPETMDLVHQYFNDYLKADIQSGFINPTVRSSIASNGFSMQPEIETNPENLEQSNDLTEQIIRGLQAKNGKKTIEVLTRLRASSFTAQLRHSQRLLVEGINENNQFKFQIGLQGMDPNYQRQYLQQSTESMMDAVSSMKATSTEKDYFNRYIGNYMHTPVDQVLNNLRNFVLNGDPQNKDAPHGFADFVIPSLGEGIYGTPFVPGTLSQNGQVLDTSLSGMVRRGSNTRGGDLNIQFGTGEGVLPSPFSPNGQGFQRQGSNAAPAARTASQRGFNNRPSGF